MIGCFLNVLLWLVSIYAFLWDYFVKKKDRLEGSQGFWFSYSSFHSNLGMNLQVHHGGAGTTATGLKSGVIII